MHSQGGFAVRSILILIALGLAGLFIAKPQAYNYIAYGPKAINGLSAKLLCSGVFVAGREADDVFHRDVVPSHQLAAHGSYDINRQLEEVTVSSYGLYTQKAKYNPGLGCSLYHNDAPNFEKPSLAQTDGFDWGPAQIRDDIQSLLSTIESENTSKPHIDTRAMVVIHKGKVVGEHYAEGFDRDSLFLSWSMAKAVTSSLVGIWLEDKQENMDQSPGFSEWEGDERKEIHLRHLLNMASGLKFEETYEPGDDATSMLFFEDDAAAYARQSKREAAPGEKWIYSSGSTNMLSGWLKDKTGGPENYYRFAFEKLFHPTGMGSAVFEPDASGTFIGSSYLYMNARDWAKFGQLYLQRGNMNGQQIVPEHWVDFVKTPIPAAPLGQYGGQFWLNAGDPEAPANRKFPDCPRDLYLASGHNGQYVAIIPSKELVIVRLGWSNKERFDLNRHFASIINKI